MLVAALVGKVSRRWVRCSQGRKWCCVISKIITQLTPAPTSPSATLLLVSKFKLVQLLAMTIITELFPNIIIF